MPVHRDRLDLDGTSRLSAHLHFGEISPRQIFAATPPSSGGDKFLSELGWREFSHHLLYAHPELSWRNFNPRFDGFPYRERRCGSGPGGVGRPAIPWWTPACANSGRPAMMHNRARMIAASFLIKHLLIDWREGEGWFWDTLVDADAANNAASWQWVAGCGADAAPYFRIFNPVLQGEKFDPDGAYVRRYCPRTGALAGRLHPRALGRAGNRAGASRRDAGRDLSAQPIVDHDFARRRALDALAAGAPAPLAWRKAHRTGHENHFIGSRRHRQHAADQIARGLAKPPAARSTARRNSSIPAGRSRTAPRWPSSATRLSAARCKPGGTIVEGTAGNTGIGLALVANALGYRTVIVIPDTQSEEKKSFLRLQGAELIEVPAVPYANPDNYVKYSGRLAEELAQEKTQRRDLGQPVRQCRQPARP